MELDVHILFLFIRTCMCVPVLCIFASDQYNVDCEVVKMWRVIDVGNKVLESLRLLALTSGMLCFRMWLVISSYCLRPTHQTALKRSTLLTTDKKDAQLRFCMCVEVGIACADSHISYHCIYSFSEIEIFLQWEVCSQGAWMNASNTFINAKTCQENLINGHLKWPVAVIAKAISAFSPLTELKMFLLRGAVISCFLNRS